MDIKVLPLPMTKRVVQFKILGGEFALWYLRRGTHMASASDFEFLCLARLAINFRNGS